MMAPGSFYPDVAADGLIGHIGEVIEHHLGDAAGTLFFLMGAMTIVEIVDSNGGFNFVRDALKTRSKRKLMWRVAFMTFFLSAILDNLTTSIVMIMVLRKLVQSRGDRLIYAALIVISANSVDQGRHHHPGRAHRDIHSFTRLDGHPGLYPAVFAQREVR